MGELLSAYTTWRGGWRVLARWLGWGAGPTWELECTLPCVVPGWKKWSKWQGLAEVDEGEGCGAGNGRVEYF